MQAAQVIPSCRHAGVVLFPNATPFCARSLRQTCAGRRRRAGLQASEPKPERARRRFCQASDKIVPVSSLSRAHRGNAKHKRRVILRCEFVHRHAKFCRKPLYFFCCVRRRLTKRTAKGIALCLRLKKPKAFFMGQTCRTLCRTRKVLPPCGRHFYIKACRYLPENRKKNKK